MWAWWCVGSVGRAGGRGSPLLLKQPSQRQKMVHWTPVWQHSQYFLRHLVFLHLQPFLTVSGSTPRLKPLVSGRFSRSSSMKPWTLRARASMTACWCSSLLAVWLPQEWQLQVSEQKSCFWKHSQQSLRQRERLQLQPGLRSATAASSASSLYTNGIIILCELLESLRSEKEEEESRTVCDTEKLSSNFLMNDFRKDQDPTEFSVYRWLRSLSEFYRELSCFMEEGMSRSFELDEFRIFLKSDRWLSRFLVDRQWMGFQIFSISMKWFPLASTRNCQKMSFLTSASSSSISSGRPPSSDISSSSINYYIEPY